MKRTAKIRNIILGEGMPKICVPVTGTNDKDIIKSMENIYGTYKENVDIIELRIDFYEDVFDDKKLISLLGNIREIIKDIALLFTFRTKNEGGEKEISAKNYTELLKTVIDSGMADAVDVEAFFDDGILEDICVYAKKKNISVIASNHNFTKTPQKEEIVKRLKYMEEKGADVAKIAVMPQTKKDVVTLIDALSEADETVNVPVIAISMGKLGAVSRIAGEVFGSCLTFGVADKASAPGQIEAGVLKKTMELLKTE